MNNTLSGRFNTRAQKQRKSPVRGSKVVMVTYGSGCLQEFKSQFKLGFTKVAVTRAGCLHEWTLEIFHYFL